MTRGKALRDWDRGQVTVRLTTRRKERLMLLAAREALSGGPTDAIDRAVELALTPETPDQLREEIVELREALTESDAARERTDERLGRSLFELLEIVAGLSKTLRELGSEG